MNSVNLIGNLTRDPEVRYTDGQLAVCRFSIAINRGKDKNGNDRGADFPNCVAFGGTAENIGKFFYKGRKIGIIGRLQTGSYEKDGIKRFTTDVIVDRFAFCDSPNGASAGSGFVRPEGAAAINDSDIPDGFEVIDDEDIPF